MALVDTETGELVSDLTRAEARDLTETIKSNVDSLWSLLKESYDRRAWAALGYGSWREYATTEFGMSQSHAYRLLDQARVIAEIEAAANSPMGEILSERDARDLKPVLAEAKRAVEEATAGEKSDEDKQEAARKALDGLRDAMVARQRPTRPTDVSAEGLAALKDRVKNSDVGYREAWSKQRVSVRSGLLTLDPERAARVIEQDERGACESFVKDVRSWLDRLEAALTETTKLLSDLIAVMEADPSLLTAGDALERLAAA